MSKRLTTEQLFFHLHESGLDVPLETFLKYEDGFREAHSFVLQESEEYPELEGKWKKGIQYWIAGGIGALSGFLASPEWASPEHVANPMKMDRSEKMGLAGSALVGVPLAMLIYHHMRWLYSRCRHDRKGTAPYYGCLIGGLDKMIAKLKADISQIKSSKVSEEKKRKLMAKWQGKLDKLMEKRAELTKKMKDAPKE